MHFDPNLNRGRMKEGKVPLSVLRSLSVELTSQILLFSF